MITGIGFYITIFGSNMAAKGWAITAFLGFAGIQP